MGRAGFDLTPHEVMRGIKVEGDALVLRPGGGIQAACWLEAGLGGALAAAWALAGGGWWLLTPVALAVAVSAARRARVSIRATAQTLTVSNRWRTQEVPLRAIARVTVEEIWRPFRQPFYLFTRPSVTGRDWEVAVITLENGSTIKCDALVSMAAGDRSGPDPTPASVKAAALRRWMVSLQDA